jgi:hypothetical protein
MNLELLLGCAKRNRLPLRPALTLATAKEMAKEGVTGTLQSLMSDIVLFATRSWAEECELAEVWWLSCPTTPWCTMAA